jgi:uncharacterized protein DUF4864
MKRLVLALLAVAAAATAAADEGRLTGADLVEIRAVIQRQIDAFRACERDSAAPGAPAAVSFLDLMVIGVGDVVQRVRVTDRAGAVWLAYYAMQRQTDGRWRANGCRLVQPAKTISAAYRPQ